MDLPGLLFFQFLRFTYPPRSQVEPSASQPDFMWRPTGSSIWSLGPASRRPSPWCCEAAAPKRLPQRGLNSATSTPYWRRSRRRSCGNTWAGFS